MDVISILNYFGFTPQNVTPLVVIGGLGIWCVFKHTKPVRDSIDGIKNNVTAICGFLSTKNPSTFPSSILRSMSPLQIQPEGFQIIKESGLEDIMKEPTAKAIIFSYVDKSKPSNKFDVEKQALFAYSVALADEAFMERIKIYLYNNPTHSEVFPTLASIYIRDMYLADHPEIKE